MSCRRTQTSNKKIQNSTKTDRWKKKKKNQTIGRSPTRQSQKMMNDEIMFAVPGSPAPTDDQVAEARHALAVVHATQTVARLAYPNLARHRSCHTGMVPELERLATRLMPETWAERGLPEMRGRAYEISHFEKTMLTARVVHERERQMHADEVVIGNGCCTRSGCPTSVFQLCVLRAIEQLERYCHQCAAQPPTLRACGACGVATYCSAECQRAHWPTHRGECTPRHDAPPAPCRPD